MLQPPMQNLHATGGKTTEKIANVAASRVQNLHALAAITLQSRKYISMTLGKQILSKEMKTEHFYT